MTEAIRWALFALLLGLVVQGLADPKARSHRMDDRAFLEATRRF